MTLMHSRPAFITMPIHVRAADFGHVLVLIDYHSGRVQGLIPAAAERFRVAARLGRSYPLGKRLCAQLLAARLLVPTDSASPWKLIAAHSARSSWGSTEHAAGATRPLPVSRQHLLGAASALIAVSSVKAAGNKRAATARIVRTLQLAMSTALRPATPEEAYLTVTAIRAAGWYSPGRTACLEESAAAVLSLAARRLSVTWCHGVAADPVRMHAWVQTEDGTAVGEPVSTLAYTPVLVIGAHHHHRSRPDHLDP
ncbi:lasso peptide biosynthesis B2 protein [Kitasatospora purpeofusca]|uniref:lasso peptide biosynthesis B2 protein n=1 Tax=Kitasatospora purpeofusca TaxID=67352 RepID=UPI0033EA2687